MTEMSTRQIIEETVEYYNTHPRGTNPVAGCVYYREQAEGPPLLCGVSRCLENPEKFKSCSSGVHGIWDKAEALDEDLKPQYRGHPLVFWEALQRFHDERTHWEENQSGGQNLTERGEAVFRLIMWLSFS